MGGGAPHQGREPREGYRFQRGEEASGVWNVWKSYEMVKMPIEAGFLHLDLG